MKKKVALFMVAVLSVATMAMGCGKEASKEDTSKEQFIVGFDQNFPPMGFVGDDGEFTGFDLELAAEVAERLDMELVLTPIDWDAKDMELKSGTISCIWNGFTMNGREDEYTWTDAYLDNKQVFVVRSGEGIESMEDLAGKVVDVQTDSSAQAALDELPELVASFESLNVIPDYNTAFMELEAGAADAVAMDIVVASYQIEQRDADFEILDDALATEEYGVGFKKVNDTLRDQVQKALEEMAADGTMAEISTKWFGEDITTIGK